MPSSKVSSLEITTLFKSKSRCLYVLLCSQYAMIITGYLLVFLLSYRLSWDNVSPFWRNTPNCECFSSCIFLKMKQGIVFWQYEVCNSVSYIYSAIYNATARKHLVNLLWLSIAQPNWATLDSNAQQHHAYVWRVPYWGDIQCCVHWKHSAVHFWDIDLVVHSDPIVLIDLFVSQSAFHDKGSILSLQTFSGLEIQ